MESKEIRILFSQLRSELVPLLKEIQIQGSRPRAFVGEKFSIDKQKEFSRIIIKDMGFPMSRGRLDDSHHPFMIRLASDDCRITIRSKESNPMECIFSAVHEAGHALYELGVDPLLDRSPLGTGASMSLHESQSRFWENLLGRSRPFWNHYFPLLKEYFPAQLADVSLDTFLYEVNRVEPSLIRTQADEVTYNLHVMIRFDLEADLLAGKLAVKDLPQAWNSRYNSDLGIVPSSDREGCLQDMHWYSGGIGGYFQSYTLGNVMSAMFLDQLQKELPNMWADVERGDFSKILEWLRTHIHRNGRKYPTHDIVKKVCGSAIRVEPFVNYLRKKYLSSAQGEKT